MESLLSNFNSCLLLHRTTNTMRGVSGSAKQWFVERACMFHKQIYEVRNIQYLGGGGIDPRLLVDNLSWDYVSSHYYSGQSIMDSTKDEEISWPPSWYHGAKLTGKEILEQIREFIDNTCGRVWIHITCQLDIFNGNKKARPHNRDSRGLIITQVHLTCQQEIFNGNKECTSPHTCNWDSCVIIVTHYWIYIDRKPQLHILLNRRNSNKNTWTVRGRIIRSRSGTQDIVDQWAFTRNGCWQTLHSIVSEPEAGTWTCRKNPLMHAI